MRAVVVPSNSPTLKHTGFVCMDWLMLSVRVMCAGSIIPADIVVTQPTMRSWPTIGAISSSLMLF